MNAAAWTVIGIAVGNIGTLLTTWLLGRNESARLVADRDAARELAKTEHGYEMEKLEVQRTHAIADDQRAQVAEWRHGVQEAFVEYAAAERAATESRGDIIFAPVMGRVWFQSLRSHLNGELDGFTRSWFEEDEVHLVSEAIARVERAWGLAAAIPKVVDGDPTDSGIDA